MKILIICITLSLQSLGFLWNALDIRALWRMERVNNCLVIGVMAGTAAVDAQGESTWDMDEARAIVADCTGGLKGLR